MGRFALRLTILIAAVAVPRTAESDDAVDAPWPEVVAAESKLPAAEPSELLRRLEAALEEWRSLPSGTVRYTVRPDGTPVSTFGWAAYEPHEQAVAWGEGGWRAETIAMNGGERMLFVAGPVGQGVLHPVLWNVFPAVPRAFEEPKVASKLPGTGEFRPLPERVRLDGREYYQFERSAEREAPAAAGLLDGLSNLFGGGAPNAVQRQRDILRIAADPRTLRPVAWAVGLETSEIVRGKPPRREFLQLPTAVGRLDDFRPLGATAVPHSLDVTEYGLAAPDAFERMSRTEYRISEWTANGHSGDSPISSIPEGTPVYDAVRGITYPAGTPPEQVARLAAIDARRDRYFETLRVEPTAELEGEWIAGDPKTLADLKGKPVRLYFWGLSCATCLSSLPEFERRYGRHAPTADEAFIAVHSHARGKELDLVREFVREKGYTFPILVSPAGSFPGSWGTLSERYRISFNPAEVALDADGRYEDSDAEHAPIDEANELVMRWWGDG